ncbi:MAG TPA: purine-nucleoside phosphorylase [Peptococcaceae bacterium]|nr:purine-nucleoside phosphorylase [Peptococcaceae bacterium]
MITEKKLITRLNETKKYLLDIFSEPPELGIILGSGLGRLAELVERQTIIPYKEIPHFPVSTVAGHSGRLVVGTLASKRVMILQGRFHYYEGYEMHEVTFPIRLMKALDVKGLIVTNAAGGINPDFAPGDLVLIKDHLNLMGNNPLRGSNISIQGPRFPDLSEAYDSKWLEKALGVMKELGLKAQQGVYAAVSGPSYETPAEIRFLRIIGADLVGMSTVPEVIVANHCGIKVLGISCVTNMAAGILPQKLSHAEVIATTEKVEKVFINYVQKVLEVL